MGWTEDVACVRRGMEAAPAAPWAEAWRIALTARGDLAMDHQAGGVLHALENDDWTPRFRDLPEIRERILVLAHLSSAVDGLSNGDSRQFSDGVERFFRLSLHPQRLEHPELAVVAAIANREAPPEGARTQIGWRSVAAGALGWAMGLFEDFEESVDAAGEMTHGLGDATPDQPFHIEQSRGLRPLEDVRGALDAMMEHLPYARGMEHDVLVEQIKALRWLTEPWWPELAVVPWRPDDRLNPTTEGAFSMDAMLARTRTLAQRGVDSDVRPARAVADKAMSVLLAGRIARSVRAGEDPAFTLHLARLAGVSADEPGVRQVMQALHDGSLDPTSEQVRHVAWLPAAADALFWTLGVLQDLTDGAPPEGTYASLVGIVERGAWHGLCEEAGLRPREVMFDEWRRWNTHRELASRGSRARSFAIERCRALRWVLQAWPTLAETPWDQSETVRPFVHVE